MNLELLRRLATVAPVALAMVAITSNWRDIASRIPLDAGANAVERLIATTAVAASLRVGLILLVAYVAGSILGLTVEGRLLVRAGPAGAEVEPAFLDSLTDGNADLEDRLTQMEESLEDAWALILEIEDQLVQPEED